MSGRWGRLPGASLVAVAVLMGCRVAGHRSADRTEPWMASGPVDSGMPAALLDTLLEPGALATVRAVPVVLWPGAVPRSFEVASRTEGAEAGHARRFGTITLQTALRDQAATLGQYPCRSCHVGRSLVMRDRRITDAHQNIDPVHPAQTGAVCSTCHAPENVERLIVRGADRPPFDQSYRLCAQCHAVQADAWAGGAHGKRLDGWQGRRVVMACTDCHDPHAPALEPRLPFRAPRIGPPGGNHER